MSYDDWLTTEPDELQNALTPEPDEQGGEMENLHAVVETMDLLGGSFAKAIAAAMWAADHENSRKLLDAFPELFAEYEELTAMRQKRAGEGR